MFEINPYVNTPYGVEYISDTVLTGCTGPDAYYIKPGGMTGATGLTGITSSSIDGDSFLIDVDASISNVSGLWRFIPRAYYQGDTSISEWQAFTVLVRDKGK